MSSLRILLDDERSVLQVGTMMRDREYFEGNWLVLKKYSQFLHYLSTGPWPELISFDHDLGDIGEGGREFTGYDAALFLIEQAKSRGLPLPGWKVHSMNPVGRAKISSLLKKNS